MFELAEIKIRWMSVAGITTASSAISIIGEFLLLNEFMVTPFIPGGSVYPYIVLFNVIDTLTLVLMLYLFFRKDLYTSVISVGLLVFSMDAMRSFSALFRSSGYYRMGWGFGIPAINIVYPLVMLFLAFVFRRCKFYRIVKRLAALNKKSIVIAGFLLPNLSLIFLFIMDLYNTYLMESYYIYNIVPVIIGIVFLAGLYYIIMLHSQKEKLKLQREMLVQQQVHMKNLEQLQREMRTFRHDYKNMMLGMYLKAEEGEKEEVQKMIQDAAGGFEARVDASIQQEMNLMRIQVLEIKSLMTAKVLEMKKKNISCNIEVMYPLEQVNMESNDASRCLGILLDNAIEESEKVEEPKIDVVISSQEERVSILIKNKIKERVALADICRYGYSTKGTGRGLGLYSYRRILDKYSNIITSTKVESNMFIQELQVMKG